VVAASNPIVVRYAYRMGDFEGINESAYQLNPGVQRRRIGAFLVGILVLILPFLAGRDFRHPEPFLLGMAPFAFCLLWWGLHGPRRIARKTYADAVNGTEYQATITDEGITTLSPTVKTELKWAAFSSHIESDDAMALIYESVMYIFPKRAFQPDQWVSFQNLVSQHV